MHLHFLITLSSSTENLFGIQFVTSFFRQSLPCNVTLFHICQAAGLDSSQVLMEMWKKPDEKIRGKLTVEAKRSIDKAIRTLETGNMVVDQMITKTVERRLGKVKDILTEGSKGDYDAIVLGRRATYALQMLLGNPADEIHQALIKDSSLLCPLWVCCEPEPGRKNVLLCVDGSRCSLQAAVHVGYILKSAKEHKVTIFHVTTSPSDDTDKIFKEASAILLKQGVESSRIHCKSTLGMSIVGSILKEKNKGEYAAIAIGVLGKDSGSSTRRKFMGSTTSNLIHKVVKAAVWCCP